MVLSGLSFVSASLSSSTNVSFSAFGLNCVNNATAATWFNSSTNENLGSALNECDRLYILPYFAGCCPTNQFCNTTSHKCSLSRTDRSDCGAYTSQSECEGDPFNYADSISPYCSDQSWSVDNACADVTSCSCNWTNGKCTDHSQANRCCRNGNLLPICTSRGSCTWSSTATDNCNLSEVYTLTAVASWISGVNENDSVLMGNCTNRVANYPCPQTAKMDFITTTGIFVSIAAIFFIYLYFHAYSRKKIK